MRYRRGDTAPVFDAPASAKVIEIGDLIFQDPATKKPEPADELIDQGSLALNQDALQQFFLGVAEQQSRDGDTDDIRIATRGEFEFTCAAATFEIGDMVGAVEQSSGTALENQKVVAVTEETKAIGVVAKKYSSNTTKVLVRIRSTIMRESLQAQVAGSSSGVV
jgi:hypothetical protein